MSLTNSPSSQLAIEAEMCLEEAGKAIQTTVATINGIAQKIKLIDQIASRDGAAAFMAAIEASSTPRMGSQETVMLEVRRLAERSEVAALEIGNLACFSGELADRAGVLLDDMMACIHRATDLLQGTRLGDNGTRTSIDPDGRHA